MEFATTLVQMPCKEGDPDYNFARARWLLENHSTNTPMEFIVLPELFAIGFRHADYPKIGPGIPGRTTQFLQDLAEEHSAYTIGTGIESADDELFYNTLVVASPEGKIVAQYRKIHPFQEEKDVFRGGESLALLDLEGIVVGLEICYDIRFPEATRKLALEGAELIVIPAAFPDPRSEHWNALLLGRAIENQLFVAATNRVGYGFDGKTYFGHSQTIDPWGVRLTRINSAERVITDISDTAMVRSVRDQITCYQDIAPSGYDTVKRFKA
ncbi:hypothetical protein EU538_12905 [Candidatus Thorarchaeota archaeon]|nr:MAG: hypothetical protein EU538_12905 [Candidatus Thorarchaeota archaeon]